MSRSYALLLASVATLVVVAVAVNQLDVGFDVVVRVAVGAVFVAAGIGKLTGPSSIRAPLQWFPVTSRLVSTTARTRAAGCAIGVVEIALGVAFALSWHSVTAGALLLVLLAGFSLLIASLVMNGYEGACGCFGERMRLLRSGKVALGRNGVLALGIVVALPPSTPKSLTPISSVFTPMNGAITTLCVATGLLFVFWWFFRPPGLSLVQASHWLRSADWRPRRADARKSASEPTFMVAEGHEPDARGHAPEEEVDAAEWQAVYDKIDEASGRATDAARTAERLDAIMYKRSTSRRKLTKREAERNNQLSREIFEHDVDLNEDLAELYAYFGNGGRRETDDRLVLTALLHWEVIFRRRFMSGLHTSVAGLSDDQDCAGDIIKDRMFYAYFAALIDKRQDDSNHARSAAALVELARQSACISERQSQELAHRAVYAFDEVAAFLRVNGLERAIPGVVSALSGPLLLFYDVEKDRGTSAPLTEWFHTNRELLVQAARSGRLPSAWHGLWLFDRRSGHAFGYQASISDSDENEVDLEVFFASIVSPENLGQYGCSFSEMIERGKGPLGYLCAGSECAERDPTRGRVRRRRLRGAAGARARDLRRRGVTGRTTLPPGLVAANICRDKSGGDGPGGRPCAQSRDVADRLRMNGTLACISGPLVGVSQQDNKVLRCLAEATGRCSSPVESAVKALQEALFTGIRVGKDCMLTHSPEEKEEEAWEDYLEASEEHEKAKEEAERLAAEFRKAKDLADKAKEAVEAAEGAKGEWDFHLEYYGLLPAGVGDVIVYAFKQTPFYKELESNVVEAKDRADKLQRYQDQADTLAQVAARKVLDEEDKANKAFLHWRKTWQQKQCPPDVPDCGGDDCSAMSEAAKRTLECVMDTINSVNELPTNLPGNIDPPFDAPTGGQNCFDSMNLPVVSETCWAVDCGPQLATYVDPNGECSCTQNDGQAGTLRGVCGDLDCGPESTPIFRAGMCGCEPLAGGGGMGPIPPGPFFLPPPPVALHVQALNRSIFETPTRNIDIT